MGAVPLPGSRLVRAGRLRHRIRIERPPSPEDLDDFGQPVDGWQLVATRWAEVRPLRGNERFTAAQVKPELSHRVRIRYMDGLDPKMRIVHRGRVLDIHAILDIEERGREIEMLCTEGG